MEMKKSGVAIEFVRTHVHHGGEIQRLDSATAADRERLCAELFDCRTRHSARFVAEHVTVKLAKGCRADTAALHVQTRNAIETLLQRFEHHIHLNRYMEDGSHAGTHHFRIEGI